MSSTQPPEHDHPTTNFVCPSSRVISFALAIVKSKPPELSVGEYIRLLRQHVAPGRRQDAVSSAHRHLDRSAYWRAECERTKDALDRARDENVSLRREIQAVKGRLDGVRPAVAVAKRRRKVDEVVVPSPPVPKRLRWDILPFEEAALEDGSCAGGVRPGEISKAGESGDLLLRSIFHISTILKHQNDTELSDLGHHIAIAATMVSRVVEQAVRKFAAKASDPESVTSTLAAAGRAISFLLMAFAKVAESSETKTLLGRLVYAIVQMFKDLIAGFSLLSEHEMSNAMPVKTANILDAKTTRPKVKTKSKVPRSATIEENPVLTTYVTFLVNVIKMIDPKHDFNNSLFEGMAYCILDKLGKSLYCTVFGHERASTVDDEIRRSNESAEVEDDDSPHSPQSLQVRQARLEAPYLIHLLGRMMAAAPAHLGLALNSKTGKTNQRDAKTSVKGILAITAKECLQRTLINTIFGEGVNDSHDPFMDCLSMPVIGESAIPMPKVKEADTQEWFKEEVWRLLGWDILEREFHLSAGDGT